MAGASKEQFDGFMHQFLGSTVTDPATAKMLDDAADKSDQTSVANAFVELVRLDLRADLPKITAPVIIAAAGESEMPKDQLEAAWKTQVDPIPHHQLVLVDGTAFVVSVRNHTVITAVDSEHMNDQVFTNIDSAVIA